MHKVTSLSIGELLAHDPSGNDPWHLAIVQRELVWDQLKAAKLLDSILAGYPIGSLLLCKTRKPTKVLKKHAGARVSEPARGRWQVIDGQQRTWALSAIFLGDSSADFFLKLAEKRPNLDAGKKGKEILRYITWSNNSRQPFEEGGHAKGQRTEWLNLSRVGSSLRSLKPSAIQALHDESQNRWLQSADPDYNGPAPSSNDLVRDRINALLSAWTTPFIPVHHVELDDPAAVLEVFTRTNMEGVQTSAADIFFAGVKTRWDKAEESLDQFRNRELAVLSRMNSLRVVARVAATRLNTGDVIPLNIRRLDQARGKKLVAEMQQLTEDRKVTAHVHRILKFLAEESGLGYGLRLVEPYLLDDVLAWSIRQNRSLSSTELREAAGYLFWGTVFRLRVVLRDTCSRSTFREAWEAPIGAGFPLERILKSLVKDSNDLAYGRAKVRRPWSETGKVNPEIQREMVNDRGQLFLSVVQSVPFHTGQASTPYEIDWDHIFPQAHRYWIKWRGPNNQQYLHFYNLDCSNRAGNLCALSANQNRSLGKKLPWEKRKQIEEWRRSGELLPPDLFICDKDWGELCSIEPVLKNQDGEVGRALGRFVTQREQRMWKEAARRFPVVEQFRETLFMAARNT